MKPMLSAKLEDVEALRFPVLCSPKLDGIRCLIVGRVPVSRNLKQIPNRHIYAELRNLNLPELDGELIVGKATADDVYRTTNSGVMSGHGEPDWTFWVFDMFDHHDPFAERLGACRRLIARLGHPRIKLVKHKTCRTPDEVLAFEQDCLAKGYEGIMGRQPEGFYKQGRSGKSDMALWKLKRFEDSEAVIQGFDEQMHNANPATKDALGRTERSSHKANKQPMGTLGALKVYDVTTGVEFDIGTGFSAEERQKIWNNRDRYIGETVKYKFLPVGVKDKPRHPVYLGLRSDL